MPKSNPWPELPYEDWKDTYATLHMWTQIAGKIRLTLTPWVNHSWHVTLYVTSRGLTTSPIPYGAETFQIDFDFMDHLVRIDKTDGRRGSIKLRPQSVADFYRELMTQLNELGVEVNISKIPSEVADGIRFDKDNQHKSYDPEKAHRFWRATMEADRVFKQFRTKFIGKCSPVHFFWGSFDLAVTRFSGRRAPEHPGGAPHLPDWVAREAYSHEVSSAGFWPGGQPCPFPLFYSYAYPEPPGFKDAPVRPKAAYYHPDLREFVLPYDEVRKSKEPDSTLLEFLQSTYDAAADNAKWDRASLEVNEFKPG
jgi:hypothetical protein